MNELELIQQEVNITQNEVFTVVVNDTETYQKAGNLLVILKETEKKIKAYFKPLKENAYKAWKLICQREEEELNKIKEPMDYLNKQMTIFNIAEEKKRQEEEAKLRAEMQKQEEERRLQLAEQLEKTGNKELAEAILNEEIYISTSVTEKPVPKISGLALTTVWKWRVVNANLIPREYLKIDEAKINSVVKALKNNTNIPGIEVYPEQTMRGVRKC